MTELPSRAILIPSTGDRLRLLDRCLRSLARFAPDWPVRLVLQGYAAPDVRALRMLASRLGLDLDDVLLAAPVGPFVARATGLSRWAPQIWCNLDDDIELTCQTCYGPIVKRLLDDPGAGLIAGNWRRSEALLAKVGPTDRFARQAIVYTGGGLLCRAEVAELMARDVKAVIFDNVEWSLRSYLAGYENYRYLGSLALHRILSGGGRKAWIGARRRIPPDPRWITSRPADDGSLDDIMPGDESLTPDAKRVHAEARARLFEAGAG